MRLSLLLGIGFGKLWFCLWSSFHCLGSLVVLSATATLEVLVFDSQVEQKVLLGFSMKFSVAARS